MVDALADAVEGLANAGLLRRVRVRVGKKECPAVMGADAASPAYESGGRRAPRTVSIRVDTVHGITAQDILRAGVIWIDGARFEPEAPAPDSGATGRWLLITAREKRVKAED